MTYDAFDDQGAAAALGWMPEAQSMAMMQPPFFPPMMGAPMGMQPWDYSGWYTDFTPAMALQQTMGATLGAGATASTAAPPGIAQGIGATKAGGSTGAPMPPPEPLQRGQQPVRQAFSIRSGLMQVQWTL